MRETILIVDDSRLVHVMLDDGLSTEGCEHLHAYDADQGFWLAKRAQPDLVLLDVVMPRASGFELCKALRNDPQTAHIPVIFLSGANDSVNKVRGLDLGAIDYITKPFDTAELQARVRAALRTKRLVDMLAATAQVDALTGLHNRQHFQERLSQEIEATRRFGRVTSLLMVDVDHFKRCNDQYGHPFGDRVLQSVADVLRQATRATDVPCRYGGEEFAVILPETDLSGGFEVAERIRCGIEAMSFSHRGQVVSVTVSGGLAGTSQVADCASVTGTQLIQSADEALYRAKNAGRNRIEPTNSECARTVEAALARIIHQCRQEVAKRRMTGGLRDREGFESLKITDCPLSPTAGFAAEVATRWIVRRAIRCRW